MPKLQTAIEYFNRAFGREKIDQLVSDRDAFAPGQALGSAVKLFFPEQSPLFKDLVLYTDSLPESFQEIIRTTIYHALSTNPPTLITFAWAPGYDFELNIWQAPDTRETRGGITMLVKSRYPSDAHPISRPRATARRRN
jgi:hypothetical protein